MKGVKKQYTGIKSVGIALAVVAALTIFIYWAAGGFIHEQASTTTSLSSSTKRVAVDPAIAEELVGEYFIDCQTEWDQFDALLTQMASEQDGEKRTQLYKQAEEILMATGCVIPLFHGASTHLQKDYVEGIYVDSFSIMHFENGSLSNGQDTLRVCLASEPNYLDPAVAYTQDGIILCNALFGGLFVTDENNKAKLDLAQSYSVSDDGLTYTFTLKPDLKWSNGMALTAQDFVYSWNRAVDPATAASYESSFANFEGYEEKDLNVKALDDRTLQFTLTAPCSYIEDLLCLAIFKPVCQEYVEQFDTSLAPNAWCVDAGFVCSGAYTCTVWNHDTCMILEKNSYYCNKTDSTLQSIEFMLTADDSAAYIAYCSGDLDVTRKIPSDALTELTKEDDPEVVTTPTLSCGYIVFDCTDELYDGLTPAQAACMRIGISLAIDRDFLCTSCSSGSMIPCSTYLPASISNGNGGVMYEEGVANVYFDAYGMSENSEETLALARTYLEAAGYKFDSDGKLSSETPLMFEYTYNTGDVHAAVAECLQQDLAKLGIDLKLNQMEWNVMLATRRASGLTASRGQWTADYNNPLNMFEIFATEAANNNPNFGQK